MKPENLAKIGPVHYEMVSNETVKKMTQTNIGPLACHAGRANNSNNTSDIYNTMHS